jgi:hypothetical protein
MCIFSEGKDKSEYNLDLMGLQMMSTEQSEEIHQDAELVGGGWEHEGTQYTYVTSTERPYMGKVGKSITGFYNGLEMVTAYGEFKLNKGLRGVSRAIIVFSASGKGHLYKL